LAQRLLRHLYLPLLGEHGQIVARCRCGGAHGLLVARCRCGGALGEVRCGALGEVSQVQLFHAIVHVGHESEGLADWHLV